MKKQIRSYLALAILAAICCLSVGAATPDVGGMGEETGATMAPVTPVASVAKAAIAEVDSAALDFLPKPVFAGSQSCDDACGDELASCLQNCGTSGPACGCLPAYLECTMACGGC